MAVLLLLLVGVPLLEIYVLVLVAHAIGVGPALLLLFGTCLVGAVLLRRLGARAWRRLAAAGREGRVPTREAADGALTVAGAALLLVPGFITDALGVLLLLPPTRMLARALLLTVAVRRSGAGAAWIPARHAARRVRRHRGERHDGPQAGSRSGDVIEGEVVHEQREGPPRRPLPPDER